MLIWLKNRILAAKYFVLTDKPGFNVKSLPNGDLLLGIHLETFSKASQQLLNDSGWINIEITKNDQPRGSYTHRGKFLRPGKSFTESVTETMQKK